MVSFIIEEPSFNSSAERSYKLPYIASQALCVDTPHLVKIVSEDDQYTIFTSLMQFITVPEEVQLNSTLCGYFNKVLSFWLIKKPAELMDFFDKNTNYLGEMIDHIYLNSSIIDIIIRIFCVQGLKENEIEILNRLRSEIFLNSILKLEHYQEDIMMTEQLFCLWTGLLKKCYVMLSP